VIHLGREGKGGTYVPVSFRAWPFGPSRNDDPNFNVLSVRGLRRYPQFHAGPIGVQLQHGPKLPPL
jgi:hypothetical protein